MCFDNIIEFMHHIITMQHNPYDINPFIALQDVLCDMGIHLSKESENFETFKTYMFIKLFNQNKTKDDF